MKRLRIRFPESWDTFEVDYKVPFADVDAMKIVWHGHYVRYLERVRETWFRERGLSFKQMGDIGVAAPVVGVHIEYRQPAFLEDDLVLRIACRPPEAASIDQVYEIRRKADNSLLAVAETRQVFIDSAGELYRTVQPFMEPLFAAIRARSQCA